jgi:hypothetical protein
MPFSLHKQTHEENYLAELLNMELGILKNALHLNLYLMSHVRNIHDASDKNREKSYVQ